MEARVPSSKTEALAMLQALGTKTDMSWLRPKALVYVAGSMNDGDDDAFLKAEIQEIEETKVVVRVLEGPMSRSPDAIQQCDPSEVFAHDPDAHNGLPDMSKLTFLSEASLLDNVRARYLRQEIYTFVGPTLIAVNPYADMGGVYGAEAMERTAEDTSPHIYCIGASAIQQLWDDHKNQALIISGESGAGKTENTKHAMRFLAASKGGLEGVEERVLKCNPILEAFGNAKTARNDNSSRFGKYVRIFFDPSSQRVVGSSISNYLLEKTRVVRQAHGERNFHVFYCLLKAGELLGRLGLEADPSKYHFLRQSEVYTVPTIDDGAWFGEVVSAFQSVGISPSDQSSLWCVLAATLALGNLCFDDSAYLEDNSKPCRATPDSAKYLSQSASLLGIAPSKLEYALTQFVRKVGGSEIASPIGKEECGNFRDSLAKGMYDKMFNWLVRRLNESLAPAVPSETYIGLLDIFGFELLEDNSFEQFCINYTNEKLQQLYVSYVFKAEAEEFVAEGFQKYSELITFQDNQPVIDLLDGYPVGIFNLIDEACSVSSDDKKLLANIIKQHRKHPVFFLRKMEKDTFIVGHTAGSVTYKINGFRSKNMDELRPELQSCCLSSPDPLVRSLFVKPEEEARTSKHLGPKFRKQMQSLMEELRSCECHFVRCVKPNESKAAWKIENKLVRLQIQYLGVLDTIRVRRESYPIRKAFEWVYCRYEELHPTYRSHRYLDIQRSSPDWKALATAVLATAMPGIGTDYYLIGLSKVFLKAESFGLLEKLRASLLKQKITKAEQIQHWWKGKLACRRFTQLRTAVRTIQGRWRAASVRSEFLKVRWAASVIGVWMRKVIKYRRFLYLQSVTLRLQEYARTKFARTQFLRVKSAVHTIQRFAKGFLARRLQRNYRICKELVVSRLFKAAWDRVTIRNRTRASIVVQSFWRGYRTRALHQALIKKLERSVRQRKEGKAAVKIQAWARGTLVRVRLTRVTRAAKYIQGFFKAKWTYALFQKTRIEAIRIKTAMRAHSIRQKAIRSRLHEYLEHENALLDNQRLVEFSVLFTHVDFEMGAKTEQLRALSELAESSAVQNKMLLTQQGSLAVQAKPVSPFHLERLYLFSRVVDLDLLTDLSLIYDPLWSQQLETLAHECALAEEQVLAVQVGGCHSCALTSRGRLFAWGWSDKRQLGTAKSGTRPRLVESLKETRVVQVACGNDHSLALDDAGQVFGFGDNSKGQLGQGHYKDVPGAVCVPGIDGKAVLVAAVGSQSFAVTAAGQAYMWPYETYVGERRSSPFSIPTTSPVTEISLGFQFGVFVVSSGLVYSFGQSNDEGQQGHGDREPRYAPEVIATLKSIGEKVESVSCGFKHVIGRTHLGKVYTWGCGRHGQLGHSTTASQLSPRLLYIRNPTQRLKIVQSQAGWRHSVIMMENRVMMWFGTNGELSIQSKPTKIRLWDKLPELFKAKPLDEEFAPVKVLTSWSRSACVTTLLVADIRHLKLPKQKIQTALSLLAEKWKGQSSKLLYSRTAVH